MPEVVQDPNVYLEWFERQGVPKTELHVLLTLRTVTALQVFVSPQAGAING